MLHVFGPIITDMSKDLRVYIELLEPEEEEDIMMLRKFCNS
jgi:hypothetical protein